MTQEQSTLPHHLRIEHDSMGAMTVPADALYGAQTARAIENFPISGMRLQRPFIRALGIIKAAAAHVNGKHGWVNAGPCRGDRACRDGGRRRASTTTSSWWMFFRPAAAPRPT